MGTEVVKKTCVDALGEIADKSKDLGVRISLENLVTRGFGGKVAHLLEMIESVGSSSIGICFDTGHTNLLPRADVTQKGEIVRAGSHLLGVHLHDNDGQKDCHWPLGKGNIDWAEVVAGLRHVRHKGVVTMEIRERGNPDDLAKKSLRITKQMLRIQVNSTEYLSQGNHE